MLKDYNDIICSFTSWKERISNCYCIIDTLLKQTIKPNKIYLNLSIEEFPNKENDLPHFLNNIINLNENVLINWVEGNTKTFKKVLPILQFLNDDDLIFIFDDDISYPLNYIENRLNDYNGNPLNGCVKDYKGIYKILTPMSGAGSVFKKRHLKNYEHYVNDDIIKTYNDDCCYSVLCYLNGYNIDKNSSLDSIDLSLNFSFNPISPTSSKGIYKINYEVEDIHRKRIYELFGKSLEDSFGVYKLL